MELIQQDLPTLEHNSKARHWLVCPTCGTFIERAGNYAETLSIHMVTAHNDFKADIQAIIARNIAVSCMPVGKVILAKEYDVIICRNGQEVLPISNDY